jgi:hypothetical protein
MKTLNASKKIIKKKKEKKEEEELYIIKYHTYLDPNQ